MRRVPPDAAARAQITGQLDRTLFVDAGAGGESNATERRGGRKHYVLLLVGNFVGISLTISLRKRPSTQWVIVSEASGEYKLSRSYRARSPGSSAAESAVGSITGIPTAFGRSEPVTRRNDLRG